MLGLGDRRDIGHVGPSRDRDRLADGRRGREIDPVPVRRLEELGALVLGGGVEPEAARGQLEMAAVFAQATLAHVDDLLAFEERVHDHGPFLQGGRG